MSRNQPPTCPKNDNNLICKIDCPLAHYKANPPSPSDPGYSKWIDGRLKALKENQRVMMNNLSNDNFHMMQSISHIDAQLKVIKDQIANLTYFRGVTDQRGPSLNKRAQPPEPRRELEPSIVPLTQQKFATLEAGQWRGKGRNTRPRNKSAHPNPRRGREHSVSPPRFVDEVRTPLPSVTVDELSSSFSQSVTVSGKGGPYKKNDPKKSGAKDLSKSSNQNVTVISTRDKDFLTTEYKEKALAKGLLVVPVANTANPTSEIESEKPAPSRATQ
nr:MAG: hypothetical protein [brine shrimp arlivirus 8]UNI74133.1 MAG: hypothetical protein [brine shrimp arlivirus 8]